MNESQIEDGLRNIALLEPGLGFDPDEVANRAAKRQKTRGMALAAGAAAVVAGLGMASMVVVNDAGSTAVQESVTPLERNKRHFAEVAPIKIAGIRDFAIVDMKRPVPVGNSKGTLPMAAGFEDQNGQGKIHLEISDIRPPVTVRNPTPEQCVPGPRMGHYVRCRLVTQQDGSTVIAASTDAAIGASTGAVAIHQRNDGTYVVVTIATGVLKPGNGEPKPPGVAEDEAIALATDPAFSLS